eukprot:TRINITY_DN12061_c0_g1_i2.p1 TRINITY_DN12061_c0_g1~~TRINITY_DN12061_c0_g1_i2.p1  ORF type:complete len:778 (+),score=104.56 TRINITY_DN12061_c0_g1_i2:68-2401(+)
MQMEMKRSSSAGRGTSSYQATATPEAELAKSLAEVDKCGSQFVWRENTLFRRCWEVTLAILLLYVSTVFIYRLAFVELHIESEIVQAQFWTDVDTIANALFRFDLVFQFFVSFRDRQDIEIISLRKCVHHYVFSDFVINLFACLPEAWIGHAITASAIHAERVDEDRGNVNQAAGALRLQRVTRLTRLLRLGRIVRLITFMRKYRPLRLLMQSRAMRCLHFGFILTIAIHILACLWYLSAAGFSEVREDGESPYSQTWVGRRGITDGPNGEARSLLEADPSIQWMHSVYFVLTVFSTVGFGDMSAVTTPEIVCVLVIIVVGSVVQSIIISQVISILTNDDLAQAFITEQENLINRFANHTKIDETCVSAMHVWVQRNGKMLYANTYDREEIRRVICERLPREILGEVPEKLFGGRLISNRFLACFLEEGSTPPRLPINLALCLHETHFVAGEIVYQMCDYPTSIFFVFGGTFACIGRVSPGGGFDDFADETEMTHANSTSSISTTCRARPSVASIGSTMKSSWSMPLSPQRVRDLAPVPRMLLQQFKAGEDDDGHVIVHHYKDMFPYRTFSKDSYFGEFEVMFGKTRGCSVRCETNQAFSFVCNKNDFGKIATDFPEMEFSWRLAAKRRERLRLRSLMQLTRKYNSYQLAASIIFTHLRARQRPRSIAGTGVNVTDGREQVTLGKLDLIPRGRETESVGDTLGEVRDLRSLVNSMRSEIVELKDILRSQGGTSMVSNVTEVEGGASMVSNVTEVEGGTSMVPNVTEVEVQHKPNWSL